MNSRNRFAGVELVHVLLLVTAAELAFNRLATSELRPPDETPPLWHVVIDHIGLFSHYFAATLAICAIAGALLKLRRPSAFYNRASRIGLATLGSAFVVLSLASMLTTPGEQLTFWFQTAFISVIALLALTQLRAGGDLGVKLGILCLATPFLIHYYAPVSLRFDLGEDAAWGGFPERMQHYGQLLMVSAALLSPYCFAPRPFLQSAARLAPFTLAIFVSAIGVVILRQHYEVGMRIAQQGLGVDLGPSAPLSYLALYLVALGTITWTLTSCFTADSVSRRDIGVGLGLLVVGGYGFAWPLQYLVGVVALMTISQAGARVAAEEASGGPQLLRVPPIVDAVWLRYVNAITRALAPPDDSQPDGGRKASAVTVRHDGGVAVTHVVTSRRAVDIIVRIARHNESIVYIEIACGPEQSGEPEPVWTLYARPERLAGVTPHPEPPATQAPVVSISDPPFEQRFRVCDAGGLTDALLDQGMRARAITLLDGWAAYFASGVLRYRVHPGQGAPLDHLIPVTELAFRGIGATPSVERLIRVVDLLAEMTERVAATRPEPAHADAPLSGASS